MEITAMDGVADAFHPPVPNDFVHLLVPHARDLAEAVRAIAERRSA